MSKREEDVRADRFESEVRTSELLSLQKKIKQGERFKLYKCSNCDRLYEERSITCPRCGTRTMGEIRRI
jgi:rRNA maturation endonuclease Nob1